MQGMLILIGGAEDKREDKRVLKKIVEDTAARSIALIPTASHYSRDVELAYQDAFRSLGVENVESYDIRSADEADRSEFLEKLQHVDLVYFTGGDQTKLIKALESSEMLRKIKTAFRE